MLPLLDFYLFKLVNLPGKVYLQMNLQIQI